MLPNDLLQTFEFENGQPTFKPSELALAIENGGTICLDEINLLPQASLRFLQGILDNSKTFVYGGKTYNVNDNFNIIGTMNLVVNGVYEPLPQPLVDRASDIKHFKGKIDLLAKRLTANMVG